MQLRDGLIDAGVLPVKVDIKTKKPTKDGRYPSWDGSSDWEFRDSTGSNLSFKERATLRKAQIKEHNKNKSKQWLVALHIGKMYIAKDGYKDKLGKYRIYCHHRDDARIFKSKNEASKAMGVLKSRLKIKMDKAKILLYKEDFTQT